MLKTFFGNLALSLVGLFHGPFKKLREEERKSPVIIKHSRRRRSWEVTAVSNTSCMNLSRCVPFGLFVVLSIVLTTATSPATMLDRPQENDHWRIFSGI